MKKTTKGIVAIVSSLAVIGVIVFAMKKKKGGYGVVSGDVTEGPSVISGSSKNFTALANDLFVALDDYGTAWDNGLSGGVLGIMSSLKSDAEFDALERAFGIRKINCGTLNPFCKDFEGNMIAALNDELDSNEINEINEILKNNGINRSI